MRIASVVQEFEPGGDVTHDNPDILTMLSNGLPLLGVRRFQVRFVLNKRAAWSVDLSVQIALAKFHVDIIVVAGT
jgi:hypothetical protein